MIGCSKDFLYLLKGVVILNESHNIHLFVLLIIMYISMKLNNSITQAVNQSIYN